MNNLVIIPTAGIGSRMKNYTKTVNKSLLPYKGIPILSHIINSFPENTDFIIPLGFMADQVKNFCKITYPNKKFIFFKVDWNSKKSGTGYTLKQCKKYVDRPFWYIPCDTYFNENVLDVVSNNNDCFFIKKVPENFSHLYTMFLLVENKINAISFKEKKDQSWVAFTGLMYIFNYNNFFQRLENYNGNEFIPIIEKGSNCLELNSWLDFGNLKIYQNEVNKIQKFDFSKTDEITYIFDDKIVKWWKDESIAEKKFLKTFKNKNIFPNNVRFYKNFLSYDKFFGETLYQKNDYKIFRKLLDWLYKEVWNLSSDIIHEQSLLFYKEKTLDRIDKFLKKYPNLPNIKKVNGTEIKSYQYYLNKIDWNSISQKSIASFIHGDLQFDNIIINNNDEFKIIDWRHEFAGLVDSGDLYYDLAKLAGGFIINYSYIKENNFKYTENNEEILLEIPTIDNFIFYQQTLEEFILEKNLDINKIKTLIPIIFWNMSPLHSYPFDLFLWYLGLKIFSEIYD